MDINRNTGKERLADQELRNDNQEELVALTEAEAPSEFPVGQGGAPAESFEELNEQERGAEKASDRVDRLMKGGWGGQAPPMDPNATNTGTDVD